MKDKHKEELQCVQSLLDDSCTTCDQLRNQLLESSSVEETLRKQLTSQQNDYVKEIVKLKKALGMFLKALFACTMLQTYRSKSQVSSVAIIRAAPD